VIASSRNTKYSEAIIEFMQSAGHATNTDIMEALRARYPDVSATTVHRATARLAEHRRIACAPNDIHGNLRYDANTQPHHHFYCACCQSLRDIQLSPDVLSEIEQEVGACKLNGQLLITGSCQKCFQVKNNNKE
jgi:Fe2+ or Zn2+ uptake regulation protein